MPAVRVVLVPAILLAACGPTAPAPATTPAPAAAAPAAEAVPGLVLVSAVRVVGRDVLSTPAVEVRVAFSPDGLRALWGAVGWSGGPGGWDIFESRRQGLGWSAPQPVAFDSPAKDFDPSFAPDGRAVYFFSDRPDGQGGDDLWMVPVDAEGGYGEARNLGPGINTAGDEWAPTVSPTGDALLFASNGRGGQQHDLYLARRAGDGWAAPEPLGAPVNGPGDDFDATFLGSSDLIVFASGDLKRHTPDVKLYLSRRGAGGWSAPAALPAEVNCSPRFNLGPAVDPSRPGVLLWSAACPEIGVGEVDLFEVDYLLAAP